MILFVKIDKIALLLLQFPSRVWQFLVDKMYKKLLNLPLEVELEVALPLEVELEVEEVDSINSPLVELVRRVNHPAALSRPMH